MKAFNTFIKCESLHSLNMAQTRGKRIQNRKLEEDRNDLLKVLKMEPNIGE